ncbi:DUF4037 domain-containing protein [Streptomyces sp. 3MP-14]|uniref:DUF4037 domain-containing protein n=1 Tax=Streptomyces mimosae TaxID=2586635 RepID=A0A5N5ZXG9_9ACTN|nr:MULTISPECIES: DUF4037 domain-containing protein [Streptomyces]KAB8161227.1 DUF4037 domain-containing protein [Streptomyces mimosae]KAB8179038.1 DUF4037 domain-containing protein [Streptomyces sp. 3MP-14]
MSTPQADFIPGLQLSEILYREAVLPLLEEIRPGLPHAAARVGGGSEVLGFDTARSADHEWGPRLDLFLTPEDAAELGPRFRPFLAERLPKEIRGWPTHFVRAESDPVGLMTPTEGPVDHRVAVETVDGWLVRQLGPAGAADPLTPLDWLALPQQRLAEATGGAVYHDGLGALTAARRRLAWYPDEVWRYLLACQWQRISQEEAFVGRCAEVGDALGSAVVAARLARDLMRLCLLLARRYAPYSKWLGSAFAQLPVAEELSPLLRRALAAPDHPERERALGAALERVARLQNAADLAPRVDPGLRNYHGRPFQVLHAERFAEALAATLTDPTLTALPLTGGVDQWADNTDLIHQPHALTATVRALAGERP